MDRTFTADLPLDMKLQQDGLTYAPVKLHVGVGDDDTIEIRSWDQAELLLVLGHDNAVHLHNILEALIMDIENAWVD